MNHTQTMRSAYLLSCELLFVLLPARADTVARFAAVAGFLLCSLVCVVLLHRLLRVVVAEPFRVLLQCCRVVKRMRVWRASAPGLVWRWGVGAAIVSVSSSRVCLWTRCQGINTSPELKENNIPYSSLYRGLGSYRDRSQGDNERRRLRPASTRPRHLNGRPTCQLKGYSPSSAGGGLRLLPRLE